MRIVLDLQGAQCGSRGRGIGRYSLALARAMVQNGGGHEFLIVLSGLFPETIEPICDTFKGLCSKDQIHVWHAEGPVNGNDASNKWRRHTAEFTREAFIASLKPDMVHVSSMLEGFGDDAVNSVGILNCRVPTAATFYDLIPLIQRDIYLEPHPSFEVIYLEKLGHLRRANILLAISESSRSEAISYLGASPAQVFNISAAVDDCFKPEDVKPEDETQIRTKFKLDRPFIMCSGATDERKNHLRLISAFSQLPEDVKQAHQLAIVGGLSIQHREQFEDQAKSCGLKPEHVVITGRVTDAEMVTLYNLSKLCVCPSWHEGFGLPVLEAMACGSAVICSNTTSLAEIMVRVDATFDPFDETSIASKMQELLTDHLFRSELASYGLERSKDFSWSRTARSAIAAFESWHSHQNAMTQVLPLQVNHGGAQWLVESIALASSPPSEKLTKDESYERRSLTSFKPETVFQFKSVKNAFTKVVFGLAVFMLLVPLFFAGLLLIFFSGFTHKKTRAHSGVRAFNHFVNAAVFNGSAWETVASHAWRMRERRWAKIFIQLTNHVQKDHCFRANKRGQPVVDFVVRQGLDKPTIR